MQSEAWPLYFKINVYYDIHNVVLTRQARWKTEGISWKVLKAVYIWKKKLNKRTKTIGAISFDCKNDDTFPNCSP